MLIVITIMALLSMAMAFAFSGARDNANFNDQKLAVTNIIQEARGLSLSSILVETASGDEPAYYYYLAITEDDITLSAVTEDSDTTKINSLTLEEGFEIDQPVDVYYFPPYGDICIGRFDCSASVTEEVFTLTSEEGREATFTISVYGGYPEVE